MRGGELRKHGSKVRLQEQPFRILALLLERPGELVTREELRQKVWPADVFVDFDQGLNNAVKKLRLALGDDAESPRFIETVARRGYRFLAPVEEAGREPTATPPARRRARPLRLALTLIVLVPLLALAGYALRHRFAPPSEAFTGRIRLVVLPFDNLSGDPEQQYLSDGMSEEMTAQLGLLHPERLDVIARASAARYRSTAKRPREIGQELDVDYILDGSVRRSAGRVRVTAALVRTKDEVQLWTATYDREVKDLLRLQTEVARNIAQQIPVELSAPQRARLERASAVNPEAYEAYLKGLHFWNRITPDAERKALEQFQRAIELDPGYAPAYAGLASTLNILANIDVLPPREAWPRAKDAAKKALALDEGLAAAHIPLGWAALLYDLDFAAAEREFTRAIALNPSSAAGHMGYGDYLLASGRLDSGLAAIRRARDLDPLSGVINAEVCLALYYRRDYDAAIAQCNRTLEIEPQFPPALWFLGHIYWAKGMDDEALEQFLAGAATFGEDPRVLATVREAAKASGWRKAFRRWAECSSKEGQFSAVSAVNVAATYVQLGDNDRALQYLDKAREAREYRLAFLNVEPNLDGLRPDPRFQAFVRRLGLPPAPSTAPAPGAGSPRARRGSAR